MKTIQIYENKTKVFFMNNDNIYEGEITGVSHVCPPQSKEQKEYLVSYFVHTNEDSYEIIHRYLFNSIEELIQSLMKKAIMLRK